MYYKCMLSLYICTQLSLFLVRHLNIPGSEETHPRLFCSSSMGGPVDRSAFMLSAPSLYVQVKLGFSLNPLISELF